MPVRERDQNFGVTQRARSVFLFVCFNVLFKAAIFPFWTAVKEAYGGHVLENAWIARLEWGGGGVCVCVYTGHNWIVRKVNRQGVLLAPSVHRNSPSRIIFSNRLKGTLTELPAARVSGEKVKSEEGYPTVSIQHIPTVPLIHTIQTNPKFNSSYLITSVRVNRDRMKQHTE